VSVLTFTAVVAAGAVLAGIVGALSGLGGGVIIVPLLVLGFHVDIRYAIGASLIAVIATSSGAAAAYLREGFSNVRVGMFLEVATTLGALSGAVIATHVPTNGLAIVFGCVLLYSAFLSTQAPSRDHTAAVTDRMAAALRLDSTYPAADGPRAYHVQRVPLGFGIMYIAGMLSGLLGIGSGAVKVLAMDRAMRLPFKVSTTTSNFMIGVTAAASAGIYLSRGYIDPGLSMPVMLGVLAGSLLGTRVLVKAHPKWLRRIFSMVIVVLGIEMLYKGISGRI
jgi:uncharacterized protein